MKKIAWTVVGLFALVMVAGCSAPLSTREQGGLLGGAIGAGSGAIIGSAVGHAAAGAAIGGPLGLIAGGLIGDQLMAAYQGREINSNQAEIDRLRRENRRLREQQQEQ